MATDDEIVQLGKELDDWFDGNIATFASQDYAAQAKALSRGLSIARELDRLKAKGLAALTTLLDRQDAGNEEERTTTLIRGYVFGAKLANTLHDELLDVTGENKVMDLVRAIVDELDKIGSGRIVLARLLDHPDPGVRVFAGANLIKLMPERVVPLLHEIEESEDANSAHFHAAFTLLKWECEGKYEKR